MIVRFVLFVYVFYCNSLFASLPPRAHRYVMSTFTIHFKPVDGDEVIDIQLDKQSKMTWFNLLAGVSYALKEDHKIDIPVEFLTIYGHHLSCRQANVLYIGYEEQLMRTVPHGMDVINMTTTEYNNDVVRKKILEAFQEQFGDLRE